MNTAVLVQFKVQRTNTIVVVILFKTTKQKEDKKKIRTMMMHVHSPTVQSSSSPSLFIMLYIYNMLHADAGLPATVNACPHLS